MPTISMFYGVIIRMYFAPTEHPPPHFHVYYAGFKATVGIERCALTDGHLPKRQERLVIAWAELHKRELLANWKLLENGEAPFSIEPLR